MDVAAGGSQARARAAARLFAWGPAGVGRRALPCPRCGGRVVVCLLENLLELLCPGCGRNVALESARRVESEAGPGALGQRLRELGLLDPAELEGLLAAEGRLLERLIDGGTLRRDLRLTVDLDREAGWFAYTAAPLRDLALPGEVEAALAARRERGGLLTELTAGRVLERLAATLRSVGPELGLPALRDPGELDPAVGDAIPRRALEVFGAVPVRREDEAVVVALWNPLDFERVADLEALVGGPVRAVFAEGAVLTAALAALGLDPAGEVAQGADPEEGQELPPWAAGDDPFDAILLEALEEGAQEILVEPRGAQASLRFRIGRELRGERLLPAEVAPLLADRLEALDDEQDGAARPAGSAPALRGGRVRCEVSGLPLTLDYRILGTPLGPSIALELEADEQVSPIALGHLGLSLDALAAFEAIVAERRGITCVAAPRGSGRTRAYHAVLERAVRLGGGVVSVEARVRHVLRGVTQLQLGPAAREALGTLLRPVPDWLGLDGPLEPDVLRLAVDAALAGAGVILTVSAPDAASALLRLQLAGLPRPLLQGLVRAVVARRLAPRTCVHCRVALGGEGRPAHWIGLGCAACADQGTAGQLPLAELWVPTRDAHSPLPGSVPLAAQAQRLVAAGTAPRESLADLLARAEQSKELG